MQRKTLGYLLISVLTGLTIGYGLFYLDKQVNIPRLKSTEIFEVVMPDGTVQLQSYPEIERQKQELKQLRQRMLRLEKTIASSPEKPVSDTTPSQMTQAKETSPPVPEPRPIEADETTRPGSAQKNLGALFAKIFSQPVMEELVVSQVKRETGELTAVLALGKEQRNELETVLKKRKKSQFDRRRLSPSARPPEEQGGTQKSLEEELRTILSPEQYQQYQDYTEKKNALLAATPTDRDLFELTWRLSLGEEQEIQARKILENQWDKMQALSPMTGAEEGEASYSKRFEAYLQDREALNQSTAEKMKPILDEDQYKAFLEYQKEKDVETRLLQKLIQTENEEETAVKP